MEDAEQILAQRNALQSENTGLKNMIEQLSAEKTALSQTVKDILDANINLKAGAFLLEKRLQSFYDQLQQKISEVNNLTLAKDALEAEKAALEAKPQEEDAA